MHMVEILVAHGSDGLRFYIVYMYGDYAMFQVDVDHTIGDDYIHDHLDCIVFKRFILVILGI
jgi:hypothetical protein